MSNEPLIADEESVIYMTIEPKEMVGAIERDKLLRSPSAENFGIFSLLKSELIVNGETVIVDRCDAFTYSAISLYNETPELQRNALRFGEKIPYSDDEIFSFSNISNLAIFLEIPGKLCLTYMELCEKDENGNTVGSSRLERGPWSRSLETPHSFGELLKTMREWSFMLSAPFNLTGHPMAIWSKTFFDELNPPEEILEEIDSYPDMHLARYLKGDENHREINGGFPEMSEAMKEWVVYIVHNNPKQDSIELISNL